MRSIRDQASIDPHTENPSQIAWIILRMRGIERFQTLQDVCMISTAMRIHKERRDVPKNGRIRSEGH